MWLLSLHIFLLVFIKVSSDDWIQFGSRTVAINETNLPKFEDLTSERNDRKVNMIEKKRYFCPVNESMQLTNNNSRSKRYILHDRKWTKYKLKWSIKKSSSDRRVNSIAKNEFIKAFQLWSNASKLTFELVHHSRPDIDIAIEFHFRDHGDKYKFDGTGGTLAHAFYPGIGLGGDIHFDDSEPYMEHLKAGDDDAGVSLFITAAHEMGHSLGLRHSNVRGALMSPIYTYFGENFVLPIDDRLAIQSLYGNPDIKTMLTEETTSSTPLKTTTSSTPLKTTTTRTLPKRTTSPSSETNNCKLQTTNEADFCQGNFDAVTHLGSEILFFKGVHMLRASNRTYETVKYNGLFREIKRFRLKKIDAAYTDYEDGILILFSGTRKIVIHIKSRTAHEEALVDIGVNATHIDAAWRWNHNGCVYLISGHNYWRLDKDGRAQADYPRDSAVWQGLPDNVSAALTFNGVSYFFVGSVYWTFDNSRMRIKSPSLSTSSFWFGCPFPVEDQRKLCSHAGNNHHVSLFIILSLNFVLSLHFYLFPIVIIH